MAGDNGTSAEGGRNGMFSEMTYFNGVQETVADMLKVVDKWGGPETYPHMAAGWAVAFDTPYKWTKQVASDHGGTKVGMAIHWPAGMTARGGLRTQFHHVIDVAPTILEAAEPARAQGGQRHARSARWTASSMVYSFDDAAAPDRHTVQYFEMFGNRAMYQDGWFARTIHRAPWEMQPRRAAGRRHLGALRHPHRLQPGARPGRASTRRSWPSCRRCSWPKPRRTTRCPSTTGSSSGSNAALAGRPDLMGGRTSLTLAEGMTGMSENVFLNIKNKSMTITAEIEVPAGRRQRRDPRAGRPLRRLGAVRQERPSRLRLQFPGPRSASRWRRRRSSPPGKATVRFEFAYDGGGVGKGGTGTLFVNDRKVAEGRIERTQPMIFSADETADVGIDLATPVVETIGSEARSRFTGRIPKVTIEVK